MPLMFICVKLLSICDACDVIRQKGHFAHKDMDL